MKKTFQQKLCGTLLVVISFYSLNSCESSTTFEEKDVPQKIESSVSDTEIQIEESNQNVETEKINQQSNNESKEIEKTETMKLVDNFDADGMPILVFQNSKGEQVQVESFDQKAVNFIMETNEYDIQEVKKKYMNKSFKVTYKMKNITNAEIVANGGEGYFGMHILKLELV
jgi:hypothetical protein